MKNDAQKQADLMAMTNPFEDQTDEQLLADKEFADAIQVSEKDDGSIEVTMNLNASVVIPKGVLDDNPGAFKAFPGLLHERLVLDMWEVASIAGAKLRALKAAK